METWKPVLGFEAYYEVSDQGNVRRIARGKALTADKVAEAKQMFANGATLKKVAAFLNVSIPTASAIKHGKTWSGDVTHRLVKPRANRTYYLVADLCVNGKPHKKSVHRLVWEAFNGPILGRLEVNHINLNRSDNRLENLELLTHQQNIQHAHDIYNAERADIPEGSRQGPRSRYVNIKHT